MKKHQILSILKTLAVPGILALAASCTSDIKDMPETWEEYVKQNGTIHCENPAGKICFYINSGECPAGSAKIGIDIDECPDGYTESETVLPGSSSSKAGANNSSSSGGSVGDFGLPEFWSIATDYSDIAQSPGNSTVGNQKDNNGDYIVFMKEDGEDVAKIDGYGLGSYLTNPEGYPYGPHVEIILKIKDNSSYGNILSCEHGISYSYKGSAHKFIAILEPVTDYDYHYKIIQASPTTWKKLEVFYGDLKQEGWGRTVPFNKAQIDSLSWEIRGSHPDGAGVSAPTGSLAVKDVKCW